MLISLDWISDFVSLKKLKTSELYSRFTLATAEVEAVLSVNDYLEKIVVAEIVSFEKHPEADKLNLVTFKISNNEERKVICGASNVKIGLKTPYAPLGVKLPTGLLLEAKKIRGILSEGMLCSEEELGLAVSSKGIMELPTDAIVGTNMLTFFNLKQDTIFDIDNKSLTHRPDLWGHYGMAREFSAILEIPLINRFKKEWMDDLKNRFTLEKSPIVPRFEKESALISYWGLSVDNVTVKESEEWMKARLKTCGIRPINNIVDISNYVMLELGMPLHIFDRDLISGDEVIIKKLSADEKFKTLDGLERELVVGDTVIADETGTLVLAGIMGGEKTGVSEKTKNIFIEVANWKPALIRKTGTRLGLRTDSSLRFEKTLDSALTERTLLRALELVLASCNSAKIRGKAEYIGEDFSLKKPLVIKTSLKKMETVLGCSISLERLKNIFHSLDFMTEDQGSDLLVTVPSYRATKDIEQEADLIEEIGRMIGYDNIKPLSPLDGIRPTKLKDIQKVQRRVRDFMVMQGKAFEVMSYPLIGESLFKKILWPDKTSLKLINSLSEDHDLMRPSLIPSLLEMSETNVKNFERFRFFELGRSYLEDKNNFSEEKLHLGVVFYDKEKNPLVEMNNTVSNLLSSLNLSFELTTKKNTKFPNSLIPSDWSGAHPFEFLNISVMGKNQGVIFSVHPYLLSKLKIKGHLTIALFDLSLFETFPLKDKIKYRPLSKFPGSTFDWTVVVPSNDSVADVLKAVKSVKLSELKEFGILDIYNGEDKKFVTIRAFLLDEKMTLGPEFLKQAEMTLIDATTKAGFILK